uniref:Prepilin peptidase n=1 Tax=candidate division WOR-3 bacterium TaxID=2052148 RepID=A0A7C3J6A3_UNCW3
MIFYYYFIIFIFGLVFGSFFNVLIYRIPEKKSIIFPSSFCPVCKNSIKWYDNIPLFSYLILKGKCRYCKTKISVIYPIVELLTAILFVTIFLKIGLNLSSVVYIFIFSSLLVNSFIDIKTKNLYVNIFIVPAIIYLVYNSIFYFKIVEENFILREPLLNFKESVIGFFVGGIFLFVVRFLSNRIMKREGMGEGDIYVSSFIGLFLGYPLIFYVFIIAGIFGIASYFLYYKKIKDPFIPFVPFLSLGSLTVFFIFEILRNLY